MEEELVEYESKEGGFQQIWASPKDFIHSHLEVMLEGHHIANSRPIKSLERKDKNSIGDHLEIRRP